MQSTNDKNKKYFVKDESLHSVDGDMFNYSDIAQVLDEIISTNEPPYNVAVIGKWGLGKSSLINLVTERYKKDEKKYQIQEINAWKYEKESLRKVFLKQLWQGMSGQRVHSFETIKHELANILSAEMPEAQSKDNSGRTKQFFINIGLIFLFSVIAFLIYKIVQMCSLGLPIFTREFFAHVFLRYCKNVSTVLIGPVFVALCKLLLDDYHAKQSQKIELNFPIETTDDYEIFLESRIKEQLKDHPELKIITVIDDLDRLSIDKIVEALDALKAFVGFERCIFIVPFDDEIIKCALDKCKMQELNDKSEITDVIESELILDKLFQFKIYLPPILDFDIQQYAYKLAQQEVPNFISEYCDETTMKKVVERVLIYPGVTTPRQVKKLLNAFINNLMLVHKREISGKIQKGLLTSESGVMQIAKLSVLQADFNDFYDLLFKDMRSIELLLAAHRNEIKLEELPMHLRSYFKEEGEKLKLNIEHETLLNFLHGTEKYRVDSIAPYLYLAQDEISIRTGDELQRRAVIAMKSRNSQTLKELLEETPDLQDVILYHLSRSNGEISDMLWATMKVYEELDTIRSPVLAQCIIERVIELDFADCEFLYDISPKAVFAISESGENEEFNHQFKIRYLSVLANTGWFNKDKVINALKSVFENIYLLNHNARNLLKSICDYCLENDLVQASDLFDVVIPESHDFEEFWGMKWLNKLCSYVEATNDFSDAVSENIHSAFIGLNRSVSEDLLVSKLIPLTQYASFLPIIDSILGLQCDDAAKGNVKNALTKQTSTKLLESVIVHDFEKNGDVLCSIVDGLGYEVTEDNSEAMDEFTSNYATTYNLDNVLGYCGKQGFFELLPETIKGISDDVFKNDKNDELLSKVAAYFTESQIEALGKKLFDLSGYNGNKDYKRELEIIRILSEINGFESELEKLAGSKIIPQFDSNYGQANYREFTSYAMGYLGDKISQASVDRYIKVLASRYNNQRQFSLEAVNRVAMKMSPDAFKEFFEKITTQSQEADFEKAYELIKNHNSIRPKDTNNLTNYVSFLVKFMPTADKPDDVLRTACNSFSSIPNLRELIVNAQTNTRCSKEEIAKTITHFADRKESIDEVVDIVKMLCEADVDDNIICSALNKLRKHKKEEIYTQAINVLHSVNNSNVLESLANIAINDLSVAPAYKLVLSCLETSFEEIGFEKCSISILDKMKLHEAKFKEHKDELADTLRNGFTSTTSDNLKRSILLMVSGFRIKPQFKKQLTGEDLEYYKKYT